MTEWEGATGMERTCEVCGSTFSVKPGRVAAGQGRYCKRACRGEAERGTRRPPLGNTIEIRADHAVLHTRTGGHEILIDREDVERVRPYTWGCTDVQGLHSYAATNVRKEGGGYRCLLLSRFLMDAPDEAWVDHRDGNTLDNRRKNLRLTDPTGNARNSGKRANNTSGYKGVYYEKQYRRWAAILTIDGKQRYFGYYGTAEAAALAVNDALLLYHGDFARLNDLSAFDEAELRRQQRAANVIASNTSGYRGVSWNRRDGRWRASLGAAKKKKNLGHYATPEEAARAYDRAAHELHGPKAKLNFPEEHEEAA